MSRTLLSLRALLYAACLACTSAAGANLEALAAHKWIKVDSPNFSVITEQSETTARQVVTDLETLRHFKIEVMGLRALPGVKPLTILAIGDTATYDEIGFPEQWGGTFTIGLNGYSAIAKINQYRGESSTSSSARAFLLHEYHHFLIRLTDQTVAYPRWLDEGMADYWTTFNVENGNVRVGDRVARLGRDAGLLNAMDRADVDTRKLFNTVTLPKVSNTLLQNDVDRFYAASYYAVHYFNSTPALRARLASYIRMFNMGYGQDRAAELAFKMTYAELDRAIENYAENGIHVRVLSIPGGFKFPQVNPAITRLDAPALFSHLVRVLPFHLSDQKVVGELLARNRQINPDDGDAHFLPVLLGFNADPAAPAALEKRFPRHAGLLNHQGGLLLRRAQAIGASDAGGALVLLKQARDYFHRAIAADPGYPGSYLGLAETVSSLPAGDALKDALLGYDNASIFARAPWVFNRVASTHIRMNQPMAALTALRSGVAFNPSQLAPPEMLLLDNLELLRDLSSPAVAHGGGLTFKTGSVYSGPVVNNLPHGKGKLIRENGSYYEGDFVHGVLSGQGKLVSDRGYSYQGQFDGGFGRGKGMLTYPAASWIISYDGAVDYMKPSGQGTMLSKSGRYTGAFENGSEHGPGEFSANANPVTLRGTWHHGGYGWPALEGTIFTGPISATGQRTGKGVCRPAQGDQAAQPCAYQADRRLTDTD